MSKKEFDSIKESIDNLSTKLSGNPGKGKKYTVLEQRESIRKINETNKLLKQELAIEYRESKNVLAPSKINKLKELQNQIASYTRKVEQEKKSLHKLDLDIERKKKMLQDSRESTGSLDEKRDIAAADNRKQKLLENRLEKSLMKKNEAESENKQLIAKLETIRKNRVVFDSIYKKLEKEVFDNQNLLRKAKDELERAEHNKAKLLKELQVLQSYAGEEESSYQKQFAELKELIANTQIEAAENIRQVEINPEERLVMGELSSDQERNIVKECAKASWNMAVDKSSIQRGTSKISEYDAAFNEIYKVTQMKDTKAIVDRLVQVDEENFTKFKYIEEINSEIDEVNGKIDEAKKEIDQCKNREGVATLSQEKAQLRQLKGKLKENEKQILFLEEEHEEWEGKLAKLKSSAHTVFNVLAHNSGRVDERLGNQEVNDSNILEFLGSIEEYITELLEQGILDDDKDAIVGEGPAVMAANGSREFKVVPPSAADVADDAMHDEPRPLTYSELLHNTKLHN